MCCVCRCQVSPHRGCGRGRRWCRERDLGLADGQADAGTPDDGGRGAADLEREEGGLGGEDHAGASQSRLFSAGTRVPSFLPPPSPLTHPDLSLFLESSYASLYLHQQECKLSTLVSPAEAPKPLAGRRPCLSLVTQRRCLVADEESSPPAGRLPEPVRTVFCS